MFVHKELSQKHLKIFMVIDTFPFGFCVACSLLLYQGKKRKVSHYSRKPFAHFHNFCLKVCSYDRRKLSTSRKWVVYCLKSTPKSCFRFRSRVIFAFFLGKHLKLWEESCKTEEKLVLRVAKCLSNFLLYSTKFTISM